MRNIASIQRYEANSHNSARVHLRARSISAQSSHRRHACRAELGRERTYRFRRNQRRSRTVAVLDRGPQQVFIPGQVRPDLSAVHVIARSTSGGVMKLTLTNRRKWIVATGAALLLAATPSFALFGIGDIVFDPTSYASLVSQLPTLETQNNMLKNNIAHFSLKQQWQTT